MEIFHGARGLRSHANRSANPGRTESALPEARSWVIHDRRGKRKNRKSFRVRTKQNPNPTFCARAPSATVRSHCIFGNNMAESIKTKSSPDPQGNPSRDSSTQFYHFKCSKSPREAANKLQMSYRKCINEIADL